MNDTTFVDSLRSSIDSVKNSVVDYTPRVVVALLLVLVGFILAKLFSKWVTRLVSSVESSRPVKSFAKSMGLKSLEINWVVNILVYWTTLLVFFNAAVDVLQLTVLSNTFSSLVGFIPDLLAAALIAGLSILGANAAHDVVMESAKRAKVNAAKFLAVSARVVVLIFGLPLAASQLNLDLSILTNNITVVVAGIMLAFGLAFGLGGRDVAQKMLKDLHDNWKK
ncbi:hypothetical protein KC960_02955 [Candidatus Saccharibacteria bacterium]|nr:hypothetical protein [Candidatus Saccharibacteria bacterium]